MQTALPAGLGFHTAAVVCSEDLVGLCAGGAKPGKTVFDGECYRMTDAQVAAWPAIEVVLGKDPESQATVTVEPQAYLRECGNGRGSVPPLRASLWLLLRAWSGKSWCDDPEAYWITIGSNSVADGSILGYTVMVGHTTVFDASRRRVGFAATPKC